MSTSITHMPTAAPHRFTQLAVLMALLCLIAFGNHAHAFCAGKLIKEIQQIAALDEVVLAVKAHNTKNMTMQEILEIDQRWIAQKGQIPEAAALLGTRVSGLLATIVNGKAYFREAILTGNQGANVAINQLTTDYWQGDEDKFLAIFDNQYPSRKPDSHISRARWDESTKAMIAQVSVPVMDGKTMIGTLTIGVDLKRVPEHKQ